MQLSKEKHEGVQNETAWAATIGVIVAIVVIILNQFGIVIDPAQLPELLQPAALPFGVAGLVGMAVRAVVWLINRQAKKA